MAPPTHVAIRRIDSLIWELIDGERDRAEIVSELPRRLGVVSGDPNADADAACRLEALRQRGLVVG